MATFERRVLVSAPPAEVFSFLSRASNVPLFAPGIEEAVLLGGTDGLQGASLGLRTRAGRELRAQITHFHENERWTVVDERDTVMQMEVEAADGGALVSATLAGHWDRETQERVVDEWERKLQDIVQRLAAPAQPILAQRR